MTLTDSGIGNTLVSVSSSTPTNLIVNQVRRTLLTFNNTGSVTIYVGNEEVSSTAFVYKVLPGEFIQFTTEGGDRSPQMKWYGIAASGTGTVAVGEIID